MVSVVMATYNGEAFLEEQLLSLYNQTRQPDEVIIGDDGSTDRTPQIVEGFIHKRDLRNWRFSVNSTHLGCAESFWQSTLKTTGDIVFFADQDDIWDIKKIETMSMLIENNPEIHVLQCHYRFIDKTSAFIGADIETKLEKHSLTQFSMFDKLMNKIGIAGMSLAARRNVIDYIQEYLGPYVVSIGHDTILGMVADGMNGLYFYNEVLTHYRCHEANLSANNIHGLKRTPEQKKQRLQQKLDIDIVNLKLLNIDKASDSIALLNKEKYILRCVKIDKLRIENYKERKFISAVLMIRFVFRGYTPQAYIGDIIYMLGFERFFK